MTRASLAILVAPLILTAAPVPFMFDDAQKFLQSYCQACHQGASPAGGFAIKDLAAAESIRSHSDRWSKLILRVSHGEMPPKSGPAIPLAEREAFLIWAGASVRAAVCSAGAPPERTPSRRLNREEY